MIAMKLKKQGTARNKKDEEFDPKELAIGTFVEFEHVSDVNGAKEIAKDHLMENPNYYKDNLFAEERKKALGQMGEFQKAVKKSAASEAQKKEEQQEEEEAAGKKPTMREVIGFFKKNPNPEDYELHAWAEKQGYNVHAVEELVYRLATEHVRLHKSAALPGQPDKNKPLKKKRGAHRTAPKGYPQNRSDYAIPGEYKYPLDTEEHVRAAISYFSKPKNAEMYSEKQQQAIWGRIKRAAEQRGISLGEESGPPSVEKKKMKKSWGIRQLNKDTFSVPENDDLQKGLFAHIQEVFGIDYVELSKSGAIEVRELLETLHKAKKGSRDKFEKVMKEFYDKTLKDSHGEIVTDKAQALAIAYSESGLKKSLHYEAVGGLRMEIKKPSEIKN